MIRNFKATARSLALVAVTGCGTALSGNLSAQSALVPRMVSELSKVKAAAGALTEAQTSGRATQSLSLGTSADASAHASTHSASAGAAAAATASAQAATTASATRSAEPGDAPGDLIVLDAGGAVLLKLDRADHPGKMVINLRAAEALKANATLHDDKGSTVDFTSTAQADGTTLISGLLTLQNGATASFETTVDASGSQKILATSTDTRLALDLAADGSGTGAIADARGSLTGTVTLGTGGKGHARFKNGTSVAIDE